MCNAPYRAASGRMAGAVFAPSVETSPECRNAAAVFYGGAGVWTGSAARHLEHDVATTFEIAQLVIADGGDLPTIEPVAHLDLFVAAIGQTDEGAAVGGCAVNADQVDLTQRDHVLVGGGTGHGGGGGRAWRHALIGGDGRGLLGLAGAGDGAVEIIGPRIGFERGGDRLWRGRGERIGCGGGLGQG